MRAGKTAVVLGAALAGVASVSAAQPPFEGVVTMRMGGRAAAGAPAGAVTSQEIEYSISGRRMRMTMGGPAGGMTMLMMPADKKIYVLMAAQNAYMEMPMADVAATAQRAQSATPSDVKVVHTGKFDVVAGYKCEHLTLTATTPSGPQSTDACVSKELGAFTNPMSGMGAKSPSWQTSVEAQGFPLKVTTPDGTVALEVTKIEKKRLPNTLFTIPESYTRMQAPPARR
ncbi:MAG: DUF4412 domain-containing protein [Gemmatimonadaceae bacterium]|nr:DUF4412 domain-containing protein [Gemmatimonadaceae bacterium]